MMIAIRSMVRLLAELTAGMVAITFALGVAVAEDRDRTQTTDPRGRSHVKREPQSLQGSAEAAKRAVSGVADRLSFGSAGVAVDDSFRGVVRAFETATISAELNARIVYFPLRDGDRFKKGDILVRFDCAKLNADLDAATASFHALSSAHEKQLALHAYDAAGTFAVEQSRYEAERAAAEVAGLAARQESCLIAAPFDGRVVERTANAHEIAQPNQPLLKIVNDSRIELVLMVPSSWITRVRPGSLFKFKIDESGESYPARVTQLGGAIEPISQSVRLVGELAVDNPSVLLGMSGTAILSELEPPQ